MKSKLKLVLSRASSCKQASDRTNERMNEHAALKTITMNLNCVPTRSFFPTAALSASRVGSREGVPSGSERTSFAKQLRRETTDENKREEFRSVSKQEHSRYEAGHALCEGRRENYPEPVPNPSGEIHTVVQVFFFFFLRKKLSPVEGETSSWSKFRGTESIDVDIS